MTRLRLHDRPPVRDTGPISQARPITTGKVVTQVDGLGTEWLLDENVSPGTVYWVVFRHTPPVPTQTGTLTYYAPSFTREKVVQPPPLDRARALGLPPGTLKDLLVAVRYILDGSLVEVHYEDIERSDRSKVPGILIVGIASTSGEEAFGLDRAVEEQWLRIVPPEHRNNLQAVVRPT